MGDTKYKMLPLFHADKRLFNEHTRPLQLVASLCVCNRSCTFTCTCQPVLLCMCLSLELSMERCTTTLARTHAMPRVKHNDLVDTRYAKGET